MNFHDCLEEYIRRRPTYEKVCKEAARQIEDILERRGVQFSSVTHRVKSFHSMSEHLTGEIPPGQFMTSLDDTAGVRIVVWQPSDQSKIARHIHDAFWVCDTKEGALNRKTSGYFDDKYYCRLRPHDSLPSELTGITFELQVQTAMMNAWASVEHDKSYKLDFSLESRIRERFELLAGLTTVIDENMNALTDKVIYEAVSQSETRLNVYGLKARLDEESEIVDRDKKIIRKFSDEADARLIILELEKCGVPRAQELRALINQRTIIKCLNVVTSDFLNYSKLVRLILLSTKLDLYFERVVPDPIPLTEDWLPFLEALNIRYKEAAQAAGKKIVIVDETGFRQLE